MRILLDSCCDGDEGGGGDFNTGHNIDCNNFPKDASAQSKKWHLINASTYQTEKIKEILAEEIKNNNGKKIDVIPILHNKGEIILQFCGWSINLLDNGQFYWEDTTGG